MKIENCPPAWTSSKRSRAGKLKILGGFTLIEILIYTAIFALVAGTTTTILVTVLRVNQRESASAEVTSQLNFVLQTIQRLVRSSSNIEITAGVSTSTLKLRMEDPAKDPTCLSLVNGTIKLAEGPGASPQNCTTNTSDLTNSRVVVNSLSFNKASQYPGHDVVSIDLTMTYNTSNPQSQVQRTLSSAIARVSAATFDSALLPGSDNSYDVGYSPTTRWRNGAFSGDLLVSGNVGIGTTNPGTKLDVSGTGGIKSTVSAGYNLTLAKSTGGAMLFSDGSSDDAMIEANAANNTLEFWTNTAADAGLTQRMTIDNAGKVGIGTTGPGALLALHTETTGLFTEGLRIDRAQATTQYGIINDAGGGLRIRDVIEGGGAYGSILFELSNDGSTIGKTPMMIDGTGNVGIGTTNPSSAHLQVQGTTAGDQIYSLSQATTGNNYGGDFEAVGSGATSNTGVYAVALGATNNYAIYIPNGYPPAGTNNYAIYSGSAAQSYFSGNVGIGTTGPGTKLDVVGTVTADSFVRRDSTPVTIVDSSQCYAQPVTLSTSYSLCNAGYVVVGLNFWQSTSWWPVANLWCCKLK